MLLTRNLRWPFLPQILPQSTISLLQLTLIYILLQLPLLYFTLRHQVYLILCYVRQKRSHCRVHQFYQIVAVYYQKLSHPHRVNVTQLHCHFFNDVQRQIGEVLVFCVNDEHIILHLAFDKKFLNNQIDNCICS